jgi:ankyrin repeat protein
MKVPIQFQRIRFSQPAGRMSWGIKSVLLLSVLGTLLVSGCASPLHNAAGRNDVKAVNELLDQGANINEKNHLNGGTALKAASSRGNIDMVKLLLDRGADVNLASGNMGWTALSGAAWHGNTEVAILLIERGADINKALAGLNRGMGTGRAIEFLNELKYQKPHGQNSPAASSAQPTPPALLQPSETVAPF